MSLIHRVLHPDPKQRPRSVEERLAVLEEQRKEEATEKQIELEIREESVDRRIAALEELASMRRRHRQG